MTESRRTHRAPNPVIARRGCFNERGRGGRGSCGTSQDGEGSYSHGSNFRTPKRDRRRLWPHLLILVLLLTQRVSLAQTPLATATRISLEWVTLPSVEVVQLVTKSVQSPGAIKSPTEFTRTVARTLDLLIAAGYRRSVVAPRDFTLNGDTLFCTLRITPGPRAYVAAQDFRGLAHTDTSWLRRLAAMPLDTPLTAAWLSMARERLQNISFLRLTDSPEIFAAGSPALDPERVVVRWHLAEARPVRLDGTVAAGGQTAAGLSGRASVRMAGLLRRDRSVSLDYQHLQIGSTQLRITLAESGAFGKPLHWGITLDDSRQEYQRQGITANVRYGIGQSSPWNLEGGAHWRKVTAGSLPVAPSRLVGLALGISYQSRRNTSDDLFGTPSRTGVAATYTRRHIFASSVPPEEDAIDNRVMVNCELNKSIPLSERLSCHWSVAGQDWIAGAERLGPGDEWYLGGDLRLRGYVDRGIAARSGVWTSLELRNHLATSTAVSVFAEAAALRMLDGPDGIHQGLTAYDYGLALWLLSPERRGRLEFAWRDRANWRDGLVRLSVSQNW